MTPLICRQHSTILEAIQWYLPVAPAAQRQMMSPKQGLTEPKDWQSWVRCDATDLEMPGDCRCQC